MKKPVHKGKVRKAATPKKAVTRRTITPALMPSYVSSIQEPPWSMALLKLMGKTNWALKMIFRALRQEALGPGWTLAPRFVSKCIKCGAEYEKEIDVCTETSEGGEECGGETRGPSEEEYQSIEAFLDPEKGKPNPDYSWKDLFSSSLFYDMNCGIFWWTIGYSTTTVGSGNVEIPVKKIPTTVYVEDPEYMRFVTDPNKSGKLGNMEYFCPSCYRPDEVLKMTKRVDKVLCPNCGKDYLIETCYVQVIGSDVKARFGIDEVIIGSTDRVMPELYPTPRPVALWKQLLSGNAMDDYNYQVYTQGNVGGILTFPGYETKEQVDAIKRQIEDEEEALSALDPVTGFATTDKKVRNMYLAVKEKPELVQIMHDLSKMQSLDWQKFWRDGAASVFGVTPVFISVIESGKSGNNPNMQIAVQGRTTREVQDNLSTPVNTFLIPKLDVNDWILEFTKTDPKDELRDVKVEQIKMQTAYIAGKTGFSVKLDEFGELEISGEVMGTGATAEMNLPPGQQGQGQGDGMGDGSGDSTNDGSDVQLSKHENAVRSEIRNRESTDGLWSIPLSVTAKVKAELSRAFGRRK